MLIIQPYALNYEETYKLTVQVFNKELDEETPGELTISFITRAPPKINTLTISPSEGSAFIEDFDIKMSDYNSTAEAPLTYVLFGVASNDPTTIFRITPSF